MNIVSITLNVISLIFLLAAVSKVFSYFNLEWYWLLLIAILFTIWSKMCEYTDDKTLH